MKSILVNILSGRVRAPPRSGGPLACRSRASRPAESTRESSDALLRAIAARKSECEFRAARRTLFTSGETLHSQIKAFPKALNFLGSSPPHYEN